jgi:AcrR family transcriptional regulator
MPRTPAAKPPDAAPGKRRKGSQRERILTGIIAAVNDGGYAAANVTAVIGSAGVSRPTFYEYFTDRDECFLAAVEVVHRQLAAEVRIALQNRPAHEAARAAVQALAGFAGSQPSMARFLMSETLAGGPRTLDARDRSVGEIAQIVEDAHGRLEADSVIPDLPAEILVGATYRLLASRLRRGARALDGLLGELLAWMSRYEQPPGEHRWRTVRSTPTPAAAPVPAGTTLRPPPPLPPGRPRIPEEAVAENHRMRIMFAIAELVQRQGYAATTIAEITKLAAVDGRVFYRAFGDKQEAFSAIHELGFQQLMAATAGAFFAAEEWPERMWQALGALTRWLQSNPAIAHVGFVESYAVGPGAVQRVEDSLIAFTIFLQEGYQQSSPYAPPTRIGLEAIVTSVFELLYRQLRESRQPEIAGVLAPLIHLSLTPFLGPVETNRFIEGKLELAQSEPRRQPAAASTEE